jgi:nucleotide-binding universal stress UspA family protein
MIPQIKRILYTTDLSPNSAYAFRYAVNSAKNHNADLIILHVVEKLSPQVYSMLASYMSKEQKESIFGEKITYAKNRIEKRLKAFSEKELKEEPDLLDRIISIEVCEGYPTDVILRKADELNCDIVVMGTHGKDSWHHSYLGSMARQILQRVRIPVFIIPLPAGEMDVTFHDI